MNSSDLIAEHAGSQRRQSFLAQSVIKHETYTQKFWHFAATFTLSQSPSAAWLCARTILPRTLEAASGKRPSSETARKC